MTSSSYSTNLLNTNLWENEVKNVADFIFMRVSKCVITLFCCNSESKWIWIGFKMYQTSSCIDNHFIYQTLFYYICYSCSCIGEGYWKDGKLHGRGRATDNSVNCG